MRYRAVAFALAIAAFAAHAGVKDPVEGDAFHALVAAQDVELQAYLAEHVAPAEALIAGPLDPFYDGDPDAELLFHSVRVVFPEPRDRAIGIAKKAALKEAYEVESRQKPVRGFRGKVIYVVVVGGAKRPALVLTESENRWLVWVRDVSVNGIADVESESFARYATAVSDHLYDVSWQMTKGPTGERPPAGDPPLATDFGLPEATDFYAPKPDYVIQGYQNYKDVLHAHEDVRTTFAHGVLGFVPGDSLLDAMKSSPPQTAWPNKEQPLLQHEYKKFFERGGDTSVIRTLTAETLHTLQPGEYFYCVGLDGELRFGYEIPREEVERLEKETGKKVARANHAFLFPGEPVLTAGAFFVEAHGAESRIVGVNTQSGHYFYSNVTATIRDDIAVRSDEYLMTVGHFLAALERLGIAHDHILITKM